jgi:prepilin-type N-terminal cleavage/methylation domain-containing protein
MTLHELMIVVAIIGIAAALAGPRMEAMTAVIRTRGAANRLAGDIAYVRHLAIRSGQRARLAVEPSADCAGAPSGTAGHRYTLLVAAPESVAIARDLRLDGARLCLWANGPGPVTFNSNGVLAGFNNRTLVLRQAAHPADTLTLSAVGRVLRRY